jgi:uracil-DNA glycosylase
MTMDSTERTSEIRGELLQIVRSLKTRVQLDLEKGRSLSYLDAAVHLPKQDEACNFPLAVSGQAAVDSQGPLELVRGELGECQRCHLGKSRRNLVFGEGNPNARLVFVGEAPGADEDVQGRPFVGRAGQLLTKIISAMGLEREDVYICNILKCRPPGNRNPQPDEIKTCEPFLIRQLQAIKPDIICALGTFAAHTLLKTEVPITLLRGKFHAYQGIKLMPTYHPAYLLRNPGAKKQVWEDVQVIMKDLEGTSEKD